MSIKPLALLWLAIFFSFSSAITHSAPIGFATDFSASKLYSVDFGNSAISVIGEMGFPSVTGLAFQPGTGTLFGVSHIADQLLTINTATGAATPVGSLGVNVTDVGLAFDSAGNLFLSADFGGDDFYSVDSTTGAASLIGSTGTTGVVGLDFSSDGTLFGLADWGENELVTIDTTTGAATAVGQLGWGTLTGGIAFDSAGTLYAGFGLSGSQGLTTINPATGAAANPKYRRIAFSGLAIKRDQVPAPTAIPQNQFPAPTAILQGQVPAPATLALFGLGLAGLGWSRRKA